MQSVKVYRGRSMQTVVVITNGIGHRRPNAEVLQQPMSKQAGMGKALLSLMISLCSNMLGIFGQSRKNIQSA